MSADTLHPRALIGQTLRLAVADSDNTNTIRWRVRAYSSGNVRLQTVRSKRYESIDWPTLRNYLESGTLVLEN